MKPFKTILIILIGAITFGFSGGMSWALPIPSAQATYVEKDLGGGEWQYDYTIENTSDMGSGLDLYAWSIDILVDLKKLEILSSPNNWDYDAGLGDPPTYPYVLWFSLSAGPLPDGADIPPGSSLDGFSFKTDIKLSEFGHDLQYTFYFVSPVPEPATALMLICGLAGIGLFRGRKFLDHKKSSKPVD